MKSGKHFNASESLDNLPLTHPEHFGTPVGSKRRKFEDEDIQEDISFLMEKMNESVQDLSSYDEYVTEVRSGRLEWSPVHRSEKFWRENAAKLNDKNYELLRILITLLENFTINNGPVIITTISDQKSAPVALCTEAS